MDGKNNEKPSTIIGKVTVNAPLNAAMVFSVLVGVGTFNVWFGLAAFSGCVFLFFLFMTATSLVVKAVRAGKVGS
jgi:hypothetical protein